MMVCEEVLKADFWRGFLQSEFNCGLMAGVGFVIALLLIWVFLRIFFWLLLRTRRCNEILVPLESGNLTVSVDAVESAVTQKLDAYPQLALRKMRLLRRGSEYVLVFFCSFRPGVSGCPELLEKLRGELAQMLKELFGIGNVRKFNFKIESLSGPLPEGQTGRGEVLSAPEAEAAEMQAPIDVTHPGF